MKKTAFVALVLVFALCFGLQAFAEVDYSANVRGDRNDMGYINDGDALNPDGRTMTRTDRDILDNDRTDRTDMKSLNNTYRANTTTTTTRNMNWNWMGLLGLIGLAGLFGRSRSMDSSR